MTQKKTTKKPRNVTLHPTVAELAKKSTFTIGKTIVRKVGGFKHNDDQAARAVQVRGDYDPKLDSPMLVHRPGALDAFRLPSMTFVGVVQPKHHAID